MHSPKNPYEEGRVLLIDKPLEWTSFDAVRKIRNACRIKKVGHAGTLDPLATGLLIICTGKFTKQIDTYQAQEKEYTGTMIFGATTPSYDGETEVDKTFDISGISESQLHENCRNFIGEIEQIPPLYSAIKINGKRAFDLARKGKEAELKARNVTITEFELTAVELPLIHFRVVCSKGTYIRSLVHDFGKTLGNGAYLRALRRTRIGDFHVNDALSIEAALEKIKEDLSAI